MSKEKIFKELISEMTKNGDVSSSGYEILLEKGEDLGFDKNTVDLLIKLELADSSNRSFDDEKINDIAEDVVDGEYIFKSAITRGGAVLTPDIIIINEKTVTYKKRNKYLINVDSVTIPISKISSIEIDSGLWGTDIIIKSYGEGEMVGKKFTKSDAKEIKRIIQELQNK